MFGRALALEWMPGSSSWRQRSVLLATFRRMWGGAISIYAYQLGIGVALKQPYHSER